jgi:hypothetical protein
MAALGVRATLEDVGYVLTAHFGRVFDFERPLAAPALAGARKREPI